MYAVVIFALALLSPLPFISPFASVDAAEGLTFKSNDNRIVYDIPKDSVSLAQTTAATDGDVILTASQFTHGTILIKATVNDTPSFSLVAESDEVPFNFPNNIFTVTGTYKNNSAITNANSTSWFAHEHVAISYIDNDTVNGPDLVDPVQFIPPYARLYNQGSTLGDSISDLGDIDGDGISDIGIGATGEGDLIHTFINGSLQVDYEFTRRDRGAFYIMLMNDDGTIKSSIKFDHTTPNMPNLINDPRLDYDAGLGSAIVTLGDVYNDGTTVLAVGASQKTYANTTSIGMVLILHISSDGKHILDSFEIFIDNIYPEGIRTLSTTFFGISLANIGDVDNNGVPDLAIGASGYPDLEATPPLPLGSVFIFHMGENATSILNVTNIEPLTNGLNLEFNDRFGTSVELLETYDNGTIVLAVGSPYDGIDFDNKFGYIYIFTLINNATTVSTVNIINETSPNLILNPRNYNIDGEEESGTSGNKGSFGDSLENMGDLNGDGVNDLLVGYANLNIIGGAYILYMNSDNTIQHSVKFQIDRHENELGTANIIANAAADDLETFRKYFNYSTPPNMPEYLFQEHIDPSTGNLTNAYFDLGTAVVNFGDVHNDGYDDIGLTSTGLNSGTVVVLNRLGPTVNITVDPNYKNIDTIHYRPDATNYITVNGIDLTTDLDISIKPYILNVTLQPPGTFTMTFHRDIDASSVSAEDFVINDAVHAGTVSVAGAVVTLQSSGIFAADVINKITIVDDVLDQTGNAAEIRHSSFTTAENVGITAFRTSKNTITLNFNASLSTDNTDSNAFRVTGATVNSWTSSGNVITISISGIPETFGSHIVVYDSSHSTNLAIGSILVNNGTTVTAADRVPPEYIDTVATDVNHINIQFSEMLDDTLYLSPNDFTIDPANAISSIRIVNDSIILQLEDSLFTLPNVTYPASIADKLGNTVSQSNTAVARDGFGPVIISAYTTDINAIDIVYHEPFTQTTFEKSLITVDDLDIKNVVKINDTTLQVITEQFSSNYTPSSVIISTPLTDTLGFSNLVYASSSYIVHYSFSDTKDRLAPTPIFVHNGIRGTSIYDSIAKTIVFDEPLNATPSLDSITLYDLSGNLFNPSIFKLFFSADDKTTLVGYVRTTDSLYINITGDIFDLDGNSVPLGTIVYEYDNEKPILDSARVFDANTIIMTFDKVINYTTVSVQDFTINDSITVSDVLTRGDTIYLTTDTLTIGNAYFVNLVGSIADFANGTPNATNATIVYETVLAENLTITSTNTNPSYAKSGDTLRINLTSDESLTSVTVTILGVNVQPVSSDRNVDANTTVATNAPNGPATFAINVESVSGHVRTFTQNDLPDSNVFVDTISPNITLIGSANGTIVLNSAYTDPGATAKDGDPNYSGTYTSQVNTTLDTSILGAVFVYTYKADDDNAGNLGDSISRTVTVVDVEPITINSLSIASSSGTNFANAGKIITLTLATDGSDLGNITGTLLGRSLSSIITGGSVEFTATVQSNDTNENAAFSFSATNSTGNIISLTNADITDGSFVTIDTIKPVIVLTGGADSVLQGDAYLEPGTAISDSGNASYAGLVSATSLNTTILGPQNITYTGTADVAGNEPDQQTRTVTVLAKPLGLNSLTIESNNNVNTSFAKDGDVITVTLVANGTIGNVTGVIAGNSVTYTTTGDSASATVTVDGTFIDTASVTFSINASNADNLAYKIFTDTNLTGSNIAIDTTAPSITLNGANNTLVFTNSTYVDKNATASDASYATGSVQVSGAGTVDIATADNYTLTYTAPVDPAGNTGSTITRNVIVQDAPPIGITAFTITSANSNKSYAKAGDDLILLLTVNYTITTHTTQILNTDPDSFFVDNGNSLITSLNTPNNATESNATFTITVTNINGTTLTVTEDDLTSSNVFVDTIPPSITLIGSADSGIVLNSTYTDPGANARDGDPNYSGTYTTTINGTFGTAILGAIYEYTYTANDDSAGNPGSSTTRIVRIVDADPISITSLSIASNSGNNFANAGKIITLTLATDGSDLGNITGTLLGRALVNDTTGGSVEFTATVVSGDDGNAAFSITVTNSSGNQISVTNANITDSSFVTIDTIKPVIVLTDGADSVLQGDAYLEPGTAISDSGNASYAGLVSATSLNTTILGPQNITYTGTADVAGNEPDQQTRTVTVFAKPLGLNSLTIESNNNVNTSFAKDGDVITVTLAANGTIGNVTGVIAGNSVTYIAIGNNASATVTVDGAFTDTDSVTFSINASNADNLAYKIFTDTNLSGSNIAIDTTAPSITLNGANNTRIVTNSSYTDPNATATDASYATGSVQVPGAGTVNIATAGNYTLTYTAPVDPAGNPGNTISRTVRVQDASPLEIVSKFIHSPSGTLTTGTDFSANIITRSINLFETSDKTYALLTRGSTGAWIIADITNPALPSIVYTNASFTSAYKTSIFTIDNIPYAIAAGGTSATSIIDISSPASPSVIATLVNGTDYPRLYNAQSVTTVTIGASTFALFASSHPAHGVQIINVTNPHNPLPVSHLTDNVDGYFELAGAHDITTVTIGASVYALAVGFSDAGVQIINITDPYNPSNASDYDTLRGPISITTVTVGSSVYALVASLYDDDIEIINITDPYNPLHASSVTDGIGDYDTLDAPYGITTVTIGSSVYALAPSSFDDGIQIIDITDPYNPKPASSIVDNTGGYTNLDDPRAVITATINGTTYAFIASNVDGLQIIKLESPPPINITSNNTNPAYAKTGDTLTVKFTVNDTISSHTSQILGLTPNVTLDGANYSATLTVPSVQTESYATFAIQVSNADGATLSVTENDVPLASNVFIDTIGPRISLIGTSSFTVILNSTDPFIPGAIITDEDPNYPDTFTITINGTLDTSVINSTVTYTYTAATDGAGNAGSSVTRTVTVVEAEPITINSLTIASSSGTNYANAGKNITVTLATDGSDLGNFTGTLLGRALVNDTNGGSAEFTATVVPGDDGNAAFSITVTNSSGNQISITTTDTTDGSFVTIDTIKPVIALTGGNDSVLQGETYQDPGTTVSDSNNASYAGPVSASSIDTSTLGAKTITYTGTADAAGNVPDSINRTITVLAKPLGLNSLTIESNNNVNTSFAKGGDVITVTLVANGTIGNVTGVIAGNSATYTVTGNNASATVTVDGTFADTASVTFSINASNADNLAYKIFTDANLNGSNIAIDTTAPSITLNGANNTLVFTNSTYVDKNATASDASYATGSVQVSGVGNVNTAIVGNYTLTYTAPVDPAGNIGPVITRTVTVQDAPPINVNSLSIVSDSGNNYANTGKTVTVTLVTDGTNLNSLTGILLGRSFTNTTTGGSATFTGTVQSGDDGDATFSITATNSSGNKITLTNSDITDSSYIIIDTIKPVIALTGGNDSVLQGETYQDPGTTVSDDGNASYAGSVSASSINTSTLGAKTITYTGTADAAGNEPDQITRTVTVFAKPLGLNSLTIESNNNVNTSFAKDGDVITVTLAANGTIGNVTGVIAGNSVTYTATGDSASATVTVNGTFTDTASVTFSINASNADNLAYKIFTDTNLTGSNIAIDTTAPSITLNGANNTIVIRNQPYEDPNATASDASYATGSVQVSGAGNVDTTTNAIYTLTYTAPDDPAGNIGPVITRTVTVQDVPPINVNSLSIASNSGNNYANESKTVTVTLVTDGTNLNSLTGVLLGRSFTNITTGGSATFTGTVQSGDDGDATFSITATNSSGNKITLTNSDITDSSYIIIDTIKPVIALTGGNDSVLQGETYQDPGTTVSDDGNASYAGSVSASSINTSTLGAKTITYTSTADAAGNEPDQQTRTVTVLAKPLGLNSLTIESNNNVNTSFAKDGDVITVTLVANGTIGNVTGVIAGNSVTYTATGDSALATVTVNGTFTDTASVTFSINASNADNLAYKIFTDANLNGSNIAIDTTAPSITLNGANNTLVFTNSTYVDKNATASDASYATGSVQVSGAGNVDITIADNYTLTYTAPDDPAGNIGPVITRTVTVQDAPPINVNSLSIVSDSGNNYANTGKTVTVTLVTDGTNLNSLTGILLGRSFTNTTTGGSATFTGTVQSGDDGDATFSITATNSSGNKITLTNSDITDSSSIIIDTIKPVIALTGGNDSVLQGETYQDPGTTVSDDGNASYAGSVSASSIDTSTLGAKTITYTGTADAAGNEPDQITRTVAVLAKPLGLNSLTIESNNNVNTSFAKDGDVITVTLAANGTIGNVTGVIAGNSVTYTATGDSASATVTVNGTFTDTASVTFSINASNADNLAYKIFTDTNLTGSNIAIDTTAPSITLNGANNTIVIRNQPYEDPNATASDASYATGSVQVSGAGNVDTTTNAIYTLTYTAPDDPAGNIGPVITRTVTVQDVPPINVNSLSIASNSGNNYANESKTVTVTLVTDGTNLNSLTGVLLGRSFTNTTTGGSATFTGTVQSGDDGDATFSITATNSSGNKITLTNSDITDSSSVTIDTIKPVIVLTGGAGSVFQGETYQDPGTTISDSNNASYAGSVSNTSLNTAILGPQNITYTGTADAAGNEPDQQTRTVTVFAKPLGLNSLTIESNNVNTSFAKDGDVITVTLATNGTIDYIVGTIANNPVAYTVTGNNASATVTVAGTFVDTASVTFSITAYNEDNSTFTTFTNRDLTGSNIAIDTTAPSITLNGENNTRVATNSPYTDPGATATDASYATSSVQVSGAGNVNTAIVGNYTLTYTAPDDPAGNTGSTITRNVIVQDTLPIGITEFTITSFNTNKSYAKAGDRLDLELTVNYTIITYTGQILNTDPDTQFISSGNDRQLFADLDTPNNATESNATFTFTVTNINGTTLTVTEDNLTGPNVFVDTISPNITLIGSADSGIVLDSPYTDPGATVKDGDPNYSGTYDTAINGTFSTAILGAIYEYTYTAHDDNAGNPGASTTRIVRIVDVDPINVTSLSIASNSGNNYANAGKIITLTLATDGSDLGNFTGTLLGRSFTNTTNGGNATFTVTVQLNDTNENATFSITVTNSSGNQISISNIDIKDGSYVTIDTIKPEISLRGTENITLARGANFIDLGAIASDASYENIIVYSSDTVNTNTIGTYTLNYTAPADGAGNPGNTISRTVNVLNVAQLALETKLIHSPSGTLTKGTNFSTDITTDNVNLFETSGKTYALLARGTTGAWIIADVTNPALPSIVFSNITFVPAFKTSIFTIDNTPYAIAAGGTAITRITDISSPTSPSVTAKLVNGTDYPRLYNALGVTTVTIGASTFALFASGNPSNGVQIIDVTNPYNPSPVSYLTDDTDGYFELGYALDITTVTIGASVYALAIGAVDDGVQIINITNPYNPSNASSVTDGIDGYDTLDGPNSITTVTVGSSVYALVASYNDDGIQIINITDPYNPLPASSVTDGIDGYDTLDGPNSITTVTVGSSVYALVASRFDDGIQIIDITDPYNPKPAYSLMDNTGGYTNLDDPRDVITATINGKIYAFIASNAEGLQIIKLESTPSTVNITSNNANLAYAKTGDTLTVQFTVNNIISSHTSQILGLTPSVTLNGANYSATITVPPVQTESYATFAIQVVNAEGTTLFVTESIISQSNNIFIDTIAPEISLIGSKNHNILQNNNASSIPNVTVTDGDPNYAGTFNIATNATLDTSVLGSVVLYTYTANPDGAGNAGPSVTRTVTVVDFEPITINSLTIASSSGTNYANAGKNITVTLATDSSDLDNTNGTLLGRSLSSTITGGSAEFIATVVSGDDGDAAFSITVTNSTGGQISVTNADITDSSYVTIDTIAPEITLIGNNNTIQILGYTFTDPGANATDASYATGSVKVSGDGTVDIATAGNYTLTYTAPDDPAGNTGPTITRNVIVQDTPPIIINTLTLTSDNQNTQYAKAGDTLTLMLVINDTITSDTVTIQNGPLTTNSSSGSTLTATRIIPTSAIESNATFIITVTNANGATLIVTHDDLTGSNVFVDTIPPTITLDLPKFITIGEQPQVITGTVTDGDPNYNFTIPTCDTTHVNNETAHVYPVTCTANDDNAGNPGSSATTYIDVRNVNGTTILNSSHIDSNTPIVQNPDGIIMAQIHNDGLINPDNRLKLHASTLELNTSAVTSNTTSGSTVTHTTTYPHPLDLMVNLKITAKIERNTTMTFNTNNSNPGNFTIHEIIDNHNDDAIRFGFDNISYTLTGNALELTFSGIRSSFEAFVRNGTFDSYDTINRYSGTIDDASSALTVINGNASFSGVLYTYDSTARTVTIWTSHLSDFKVNTTSSGGSDSDSDSNAPTLGKTSSGAQLVTNGFEYNGLTVNVGRYHTEFPLIGTNVGDMNTIKMKIYDSAGPAGIKRVEVALGVPDVGLYHEAEAFVEVWMQKDSIAVKEIVIVDKLNLLEDSDVSSTVSQISCTGDVQQCLLVELKYSYREPPIYNTVSIKPVDWDNNAHQFYFNDGIHVDGDSINLPKEIDISTSHATGISNTVETLHLVQIDRAEHLWVDQYGYQWMIIGNTVRQITTPEYVVPDDNTYGTLHGPDRNHPDFASTVYAEQKRAQETLAGILGHATIIKPLPENGGTIYFDATGTDSRKGDSFKLVLELETARMQQLSNLLYDDTK